MPLIFKLARTKTIVFKVYSLKKEKRCRSIKQQPLAMALFKVRVSSSTAKSHATTPGELFKNVPDWTNIVMRETSVLPAALLWKPLSN